MDLYVTVIYLFCMCGDGDGPRHTARLSSSLGLYLGAACRCTHLLCMCGLRLYNPVAGRSVLGMLALTTQLDLWRSVFVHSNELADSRPASQLKKLCRWLAE